MTTTIWDYDNMATAGVLHDKSHVELTRGQILDLLPSGSPHYGMINRLTKLTSDLIPLAAISVAVCDPLRCLC